MSVILFVIDTPGGKKEDNAIALVPQEELGLIDKELDLIDGKMVNADEMDEEAAEIITSLYERFGLEKSGDAILEADLQKFVNPLPPFCVGRVVRIGWAV